MTQPIIRFEGVSKAFGTQTVLRDFSLDVEPGAFVSIIGRSGCGKTTTLKMINRLIEPTSGKIYLDGEDIATKDKVDLRRHIGYVIQQIGLFPNMTVAQNICVVPTLLKYSKEECDRIARQLLEMVNLPYEQYAHKYPSEMSGGQQQRIGILRALAASPPIVLMDEPFSALDPMTRRSLQQEVRNLQQKLHKTIVFVTHDMEEALDLADVIIFMDHGKIVQMAPPEEMLAHPASGQIQDFLGKFIQTNSPNDLTAADVNTDVSLMPNRKAGDVRHCANGSGFPCVIVHLVCADIRHPMGTIVDGHRFRGQPAVAFDESHAVGGPAAQPIGADDVLMIANTVRVLRHLVGEE